MLNPATIAGVVRAIVPALVAYAAGKGVDLSWLANPDVIAGVVAILCATWSVKAKKRTHP